MKHDPNDNTAGGRFHSRPEQLHTKLHNSYIQSGSVLLF